MDLMKLKNGSDIRGVAVAGKEEVTLTQENVEKIAVGYARFIKERLKKENPIIAIGRDSRISGEQIEDWITEIFKRMGIAVIQTGLSSTPSMFMITKEDKIHVDASIMITASHLPYNRNGMKFFDENGGFESKDITEILTLAKQEYDIPNQIGVAVKMPYIDMYAIHLANIIKEKTKMDKPFAGMKIIVDAGNGAGGFYAEKVLLPLGADITGSQFLNPDGMFPNHIPNPEDKTAMASISRAVVDNKADFGIIFDTDVDRAAAVFPNGEEINRNKLIALISAILLMENGGETIVTDSVTSNGLTEFIVSKGGVHHRFKRGYKNVINEAIKLESEGISAPLAIETSGHAALKENYYLDDGAYLVTRLLIALCDAKKRGETLEDMIKDLKEPKEASEYRLKITCEDFKSYGEDILDKFEPAMISLGYEISAPNYEGVRIANENGFALMRLSLHDPIIPINIESDIVGGSVKFIKDINEFLTQFESIDKSAFKL
ncbi:MAG: phosphomannomutase/phosphoglucomutase [Bacillota bacterium]